MANEKGNMVVGLDVGTSKTAICAGTVNEGLLEVLALEMVPNTGVRRGIISDIEDTISSISSALEAVERSTKIPIQNAYTAISGTHITATNSKGVIAISRADGEISETDMLRVIEAARAVALPPNQEILHIIAKSYTVDGQESIKDPLNMTGVRLEADALVIGGSSSAMRNLQKCISQAGLDINDMIYSPLALSQILLNKRQKELGVLLIDFGAGTTTMSVLEEGDLIHTAVYPAGSLHITNDIAIGLRTSLDIAEQIKQKEAVTLSEKVRESETVDLYQYDPNMKERIKKKYLALIIEARLSEVFGFIRSELKKIGRDGMLPAGVVFTGGGSQLSCLIDYAKDWLKLPAQIGQPVMELTGHTEKVNNPSLTLALGLMIWGMEHGRAENQAMQTSINLNRIGGMVEKAKQFFKQLMP